MNWREATILVTKKTSRLVNFKTQKLKYL